MRIKKKKIDNQAILLVKNKDYVGLRKMLTANFDINIHGKGWTLLHYAADKDDPKLIKIIAGHTKVDLNLKASVSLWTPLIVAARFGKSRALKCLLEEGADASCKGRKGQTALMIASKVNQLDCVKIFLEFNKNLAKVQDRNGMNALMHAIENPSVMKKLISHSNLKQVDKYGKTALHMASRSNLDAVKVIIAKKQELILNASDDNYKTPLENALHMKRLDIVCCLLENGAKFDASYNVDFYDLVIVTVKKDQDLPENVFDNLPRSNFFKVVAIFNHLKTLMACSDGKTQKLVELHEFLDKIINGILKTVRNRAFNFESLASFVNKPQVLNDSMNYSYDFEWFKFAFECLSKSTPRDELKKHCYSILYTAARTSKIEMCKYLLENGADPDIPLRIASHNQEIVELLIKHGADVNEVHFVDTVHLFDTQNPLNFAISAKNVEFARTLLKSGADPYKYDSPYREIPIINAIKNSKTEILREILSVSNKFKTYRIKFGEHRGLSLFLYACFSHYHDATKVLIENGVCLEETDKNNQNCLHIVFNRNPDFNFVLFLANALGDKFIHILLAKDDSGTSPIDIILRKFYPERIEELIEVYPAIRNHIKVPRHLITTGKEQEMCLICRDEFAEEDLATKLPCGHLYHDSCLIKWTTNCPCCRSDFFLRRTKNYLKEN